MHILNLEIEGIGRLKIVIESGYFDFITFYLRESHSQLRFIFPFFPANNDPCD